MEVQGKEEQAVIEDAAGQLVSGEKEQTEKNTCQR